MRFFISHKKKIVSIVFKKPRKRKALKILSLKTTQAVTLFHFTWFVFSFSPESCLINVLMSSYPDRDTHVPRPRYTCTPTEIHMYPDRGTHVPRSGYDNYLISFRSFSDDSCLFKKAPFIISFRSFSDDSCLFKKAPFISSSAPCVS